MNMIADGDNSFHTGWLTRYLGLPRACPSADARRREDVKAFLDGWDTCDETPAGDREVALRGMKAAGQAYTGWVDDEWEDIVLGGAK